MFDTADPPKIRMCDNDAGEKNDEVREYEQCGCEFGCGKYRTKRWTVGFLRCFANAKSALFFLCCAAFLQGLVINGLYNISITSLEKRFNLRSTETGFIASCYDIGVIICLPLVTYVGGRGHKPLWLGWGVFIMGIGSIVFSLPHFLAPVYDVSASESFFCLNSTNCGETSVRIYRGFFILGQLLHGIGASPLYTLGLTYIDENVKQAHSSMYHGFYYSASLIGPGVGYLIGGKLLAYFTTLESQSITEDSPYWVGAWWLGFVISGCIIILISLPILLYPRQLPGTDDMRLGRENEMHQNTEAVRVKGDEKFGTSLRDFPRCFLVIVKNPTVMTISMAGAIDTGILISLATFGPKYIESMFGLSASTAALYFGILAIVTSAIAQISGGFIVSKFKMTVPRMIDMCILCSIAAFLCLFIFLLNCPNPSIAGVTVPYNGDAVAECSNSVCGCSTKNYNPVCGSDQKTYLSFCDAGCDRLSSTHFENCTRVLQSENISSLASATARAGVCETACSNIALYMGFAALAVFFIFLKSQPALQASLRCVPFTQRSFSIGIQWLVIRVMGSIPLPIIYGQILDLSCLVWSEECGECGSCKVYDNASMSKYLAILATVVKGASIFLLMAARNFYHPPPKLNETDGTNNDIETEAGVVTDQNCKDSNGVELKQGIIYKNDYDNPSFIK